VASARYTLDHLYLLNAVCVNKDKGMTAGGAQVVDRRSLTVWHSRFGHPDDKKVINCVREGLVSGMSIKNTDMPHPCISCLRAKAFIQGGHT
jgi:hypothetical protein